MTEGRRARQEALLPRDEAQGFFALSALPPDLTTGGAGGKRVKTARSEKELDLAWRRRVEGRLEGRAPGDARRSNLSWANWLIGLGLLLTLAAIIWWLASTMENPP